MIINKNIDNIDTTAWCRSVENDDVETAGRGLEIVGREDVISLNQGEGGELKTTKTAVVIRPPSTLDPPSLPPSIPLWSSLSPGRQEDRQAGSSSSDSSFNLPACPHLPSGLLSCPPYFCTHLPLSFSPSL